MSLRGEIIQVSVSKGGVPKLAVPEAHCGPLGLAGDAHRNMKYHGGPLKAVLLASEKDLATLQGRGFPVSPGSIGENLTIRGIDFRQLRSGMRFKAGGAILELTQLRTPCSTLDVFNNNGLRIQEHLSDPLCKSGDPSSPRWAYGGFYASIVSPGTIRTGDILEIVDLVV